MPAEFLSEFRRNLTLLFYYETSFFYLTKFFQEFKYSEQLFKEKSVKLLFMVVFEQIRFFRFPRAQQIFKLSFAIDIKLLILSI